MRLDFGGDRLLAVVAHPDDAELLCAGTLARARADGAPVGIAVFCRGDGGRPARPVRDLAARRAREMRASARLLGAELFLGGVPDGTLSDERERRLWLTEVYRGFRPTLVLAHAPGDYHPDHRAASALAEVASWFCASRGQATASAPIAAAPALWWMDTLGMHGFDPGFYVDIGEHLGLKGEMLACHRTQTARAGDRDFVSLPDLMRIQAGARGAQCGVAAAEAFRAHGSFKRARAW